MSADLGVVDHAVETLLQVRAELRKSGDYELADKIRAELSSIGVDVRDTKQGTTWGWSRWRRRRP